MAKPMFASLSLVLFAVALTACGDTKTDVRISPTTKTAFVLLAFKGIRERRFMGVERFGNAWKLEALMDSQYP